MRAEKQSDNRGRDGGGEIADGRDGDWGKITGRGGAVEAEEEAGNGGGQEPNIGEGLFKEDRVRIAEGVATLPSMDEWVKIKPLEDSHDFTFIGKIVDSIIRTGIVATDSEVYHHALELVRERMEMRVEESRATSDKTRMSALFQGSANAYALIRSIGIESESLVGFLNRGLEVFRQEHDLPETYTIDTPQGLAVAMTEIYTNLMTAFLVTQDLASERADQIILTTKAQQTAEYGELVARTEAALEIVKLGTGGEVAVARVNANEKEAKAYIEAAPNLQRAERARQQFQALQFMRTGLSLAAAVEGLANVPVAVPRGFSNGLVDWLKYSPVAAGGTAIAPLVGAGLILSGIPAGPAVLTAVAIFVAANACQGLYEWAKGKIGTAVEERGFAGGLEEGR